MSSVFHQILNPVREYVASRSRSGDMEWENASLITGDLFDLVRDLKRADGGHISVCGSISLVGQLLLAGLLDELRADRPPRADHGRTQPFVRLGTCPGPDSRDPLTYLYG
ncbi:MAG: dihydrofolate reductase family protein [Microlunatus sp.]|nr:dihydrofolate reductase family protein [Microlunatus sp.]MDN5804164.1 dihydrofolate reductase family protein [Microlunatus sp.]